MKKTPRQEFLDILDRQRDLYKYAAETAAFDAVRKGGKACEEARIEVARHDAHNLAIKTVFEAFCMHFPPEPGAP